MEKKFELTAECKIVLGVKLFRIRALKAIAKFSVKIGDLGGWIEKEGNLSQYGNAWVYGDARVYGNAEVYGNARVYGNALVCGDARICCKADYMIFKNSWSSGRYCTYTRSNKMWRVGCFHGTGEKLIKKAYADSETSGKCYEAIVRAAEAIEAAKAEAKGEAK